MSSLPANDNSTHGPDAAALTLSPADLVADLVGRLQLARHDLAAAASQSERDRIGGFIDGLSPAIVCADLTARCSDGPVAARDVDEIEAEVCAR